MTAFKIRKNLLLTIFWDVFNEVKSKRFQGGGEAKDIWYTKSFAHHFLFAHPKVIYSRYHHKHSLSRIVQKKINKSKRWKWCQCKQQTKTKIHKNCNLIYSTRQQRSGLQCFMLYTFILIKSILMLAQLFIVSSFWICQNFGLT